MKDEELPALEAYLSEEHPIKTQAKIQSLLDKCCACVEATVSPMVGGQDVSLSIRVASNDEVQSLNAQFRKKDKPTNVLSFPVWEEDEGKLYLGDIIIAAPVIEAEAEEQGKAVDNHLCHMMIHGILHLYGFDHIEDFEAEEMESLEIHVLAEMGIANPYV